MTHGENERGTGYTPGRGQKQLRAAPQTHRTEDKQRKRQGAQKKRASTDVPRTTRKEDSRQTAPRTAREEVLQQPTSHRDAPGRRPREATDGHAPLYDQDQMRLGGAPQSKERRRKQHHRLTQSKMRRRKRNRRITTFLLVLILIGIGVGLTILLLFKVQKFEIQTMDGQTPADTGIYAEQDILDALAVAKGDNIFSFRLADKAGQINTALPLLEQVKLLRRLPDTIVIRVEPAAESFCIQTESGWAVLSRHLKVISLAGEQPALPVLLVESSAIAQPGVPFTLTTEEDTAALDELLNALDTAGLLDGITEIDMRDTTNISYVYEGRIRAKLGTMNSLAYKLQWGSFLIFNKDGHGISASDMGILDTSHLKADGTMEPPFAQGDPNAEPTPVPQATTEPDPASSAASSDAVPAA